MPDRLRIGLTGGIASGKSAAAERFAELGVPVIDADESARAVVTPGAPALEEIVRAFGAHVLDAEGKLDRAKLRRLIFDEPRLRRRLESILHPSIRADMERRALQVAGTYVVLVVPLLIESAQRIAVDRILVVDADEGLQIQRLMSRDGETDVRARAILAAQATRAKRLQAADDVLRNTGSLDDLRMGVDRLHELYARMAGERNHPS